MNNISLGQLAKKNLRKMALEVDKSLEEYWNQQLKVDFGFEKTQKELSRKILEHAKEHNLRPAKRIRATLVYYGYLLGKEKIEKNKEIWKAMEAMELVQTALLMHDDFMDEDKLRRGLPTTHEYFGEGDRHYGESMAVNTGDLVLCLGYERMLECNLDKEKVLKATKQLMRGIAETALGQSFDVSLPKLGDITEEKVLAVHRTKTSIYTFQNPLLVGGILGGLSSKAMEILKEYSQYAGMAFQLQDDVLGLFGETEKTGKSTNSDLLQGKSTLLISKAMELGSTEQKKSVQKAWGNKKATEKEIIMAKTAIKDSGAYEYSVKKSRELAKRAEEKLVILEKQKVNQEAVTFLKGITEYIVNRDL